LDNEGVVQLQRQLMQDQDLDVEELAKIVRRQREMGLAIHGELELQNEMLDRVDKDVDRVKGKIDIAKKRVSKIS
jgi:regulator of vacuolar morphogenesis